MSSHPFNIPAIVRLTRLLRPWFGQGATVNRDKAILINEFHNHLFFAFIITRYRYCKLMRAASRSCLSSQAFGKDIIRSFKSRSAKYLRLPIHYLFFRLQFPRSIRRWKNSNFLRPQGWRLNIPGMLTRWFRGKLTSWLAGEHPRNIKINTCLKIKSRTSCAKVYSSPEVKRLKLNEMYGLYLVLRKTMLGLSLRCYYFSFFV